MSLPIFPIGQINFRFYTALILVTYKKSQQCNSLKKSIVSSDLILFTFGRCGHYCSRLWRHLFRYRMIAHCAEFFENIFTFTSYVTAGTQKTIRANQARVHTLNKTHYIGTLILTNYTLTTISKRKLCNRVSFLNWIFTELHVLRFLEYK